MHHVPTVEFPTVSTLRPPSSPHRNQIPSRSFRISPAFQSAYQVLNLLSEALLVSPSSIKHPGCSKPPVIITHLFPGPPVSVLTRPLVCHPLLPVSACFYASPVSSSSNDTSCPYQHSFNVHISCCVPLPHATITDDGSKPTGTAPHSYSIYHLWQLVCQ